MVRCVSSDCYLHPQAWNGLAHKRQPLVTFVTVQPEFVLDSKRWTFWYYLNIWVLYLPSWWCVLVDKWQISVGNRLLDCIFVWGSCGRIKTERVWRASHRVPHYVLTICSVWACGAHRMGWDVHAEYWSQAVDSGTNATLCWDAMIGISSGSGARRTKQLRQERKAY